MESVNSVSSSGGSAYSSPASKSASYEANAAEYGSIMATVMEAASAVKDSVGEAISDTGTAIGHAVDDVEAGLSELGSHASALASEGVDALEHAGHAIATTTGKFVDGVEDKVSSAISWVGDELGAVGHSTGNAVGSIAAYVTMGVATVKQSLVEVA